MTSHFHEMVFVHVPKCAGMSVEQALGGLSPEHRLEQHWSSATIRRFYPDEWADYRRFAVVRHPFDRSMSMVRFLRRYDPVIRRHLSHVSDGQLLFDLLMNHNVLTQHTSDAMLCDEVELLRFESLAEYWSAFARGHPLPTALPRKNAAPPGSGDVLHNERLLRHAVAAAFPRDYERFGYARPTDGSELTLAEAGAVAWTRLHAWARDVPAAPSRKEQQRALAALHMWRSDLPDPEWSDRFTQLLGAFPVRVESGLAARLWASAVHDGVNRALDKPEWTAWAP